MYDLDSKESENSFSYFPFFVCDSVGRPVFSPLLTKSQEQEDRLRAAREKLENQPTPSETENVSSPIFSK